MIFRFFRPRLRCKDAVEGAGLKLEPDTYCDYAFSILRAMDAFALPVIVGKRFLGFFCITDVFKCADRDTASVYIGSIMTPASECGYLPANSSLEHARKQLTRSPYPMLPVLDRNSTVLGFISEESISRTLRAMDAFSSASITSTARS